MPHQAYSGEVMNETDFLFTPTTHSAQTTYESLRVLFVAAVSESANYTAAVIDSCRRFPTFRSSLDCPFPGYCTEIMGLLAKSMNMRLEPVVMNISMYKAVNVSEGRFRPRVTRF